MRNFILVLVTMTAMAMAHENFFLDEVLQGRNIADDIQFNLYTSISDGGSGLVLSDISSIVNSKFDYNKRTVILIHDWSPLSSNTDYWLQFARYSIFAKHINTNIIELEWKKLSSTNYFTTAPRAMIIGESLAALLKAIQASSKQLDPAKVSLVGVGMGAHIAGVCGSRMSGIGQILGLDPAGQWFKDQPIADRLDKAHAKSVQVTHVDDTGYGWPGTHGTVDVFINGGGPQPGLNTIEGSIATILTEGRYNDLGGSHAYVIPLFLSSINNQVKVFTADSASAFEEGDFSDSAIYGLDMPDSVTGSCFATKDTIEYREEDVKFNFYSSSTSEKKMLHINDADSIINSGFDAAKDTEIYIPDWQPLSVQNSEWTKTSMMKSFEKGAKNIIVVDWSSMGYSDYFKSAKISVMIGYSVANLLKAIKATPKGLDVSKVSIVSHGVGAHIAGVCGGFVPDMAQIIGLSPAGHYFKSAGKKLKLQKGRAKFTQVCHTDSDGYGYDGNLGDADIYLNGGKKQPGAAVSRGNITEALLKGDYDALGGSHDVAADMFADTIEKDFFGYNADSYEDFLAKLAAGTLGTPIVLGPRMDPTSSGSVFAKFDTDTSSKEEIMFNLYTSNEDAVAGKSERLVSSILSTITDSKFDKTKDTRIIVNDWYTRTSGNYEWMGKCLCEYFKRENSQNVIEVDWRKLSSSNYFTTVQDKAPEVAAALAELLEAIHDSSKGLDESTVTVVGHGIGAHIAGLAAKKYKADKGTALNRITAIGAAGVWYSDQPASKHLTKDDAVFVEAIHTDDGVYQWAENYGTVDVRINGGKNQPGLAALVGDLNAALLGGNYNAIGKSHDFGPTVYVESINTPIVVKGANTYQEFLDGIYTGKTFLGLDMSTTSTGKYFSTVSTSTGGANGDGSNAQVKVQTASSRRLGTITLVVMEKQSGAMRTYNLRGTGSDILNFLGGEMVTTINLDENLTMDDYDFGIVFSGSIITSSFEINSMEVLGTAGPYTSLVYSSCKRNSVPSRCSAVCPKVFLLKKGTC